jgi:EAL domain-containing protein (putative c-di-GMP-specific phosphodiesterase class I)
LLPAAVTPRPLSPRRGRWLEWWRLSGLKPQRARLMALDARGWLLLALPAVGLVVAATVGALWWQAQQHSAHSAQAALHYVDEQLDMLDQQLQRVATAAATAARQEPALACPAELSALLLDESLLSLMVRRFVVVAADGSPRCTPDGASTAYELPMQPRDELALVARRAIDRQLLALRAAGPGVVAVALLDPRALQPGDEAGQAWAHTSAQRVTLLSADARKLQSWGAERMQRSVPALQVQRASKLHQVAVVVELDADAFEQTLWRHGAAAAVLTLLLLAGAAAACWRRAMLRSRLYHRLALALRKRQFEPFVQPIVDVASGRCVGGEVLMRWAHPQRGILGPGEFIDEAERTGLIVGMSDLVMARAAHRLAPLAAACPQLYFSFNITPEQLRGPLFARHLAELFRADTLPREQVLLELTEREFVDPVASGTLLQLRGQGWRIAIDDFGTGQSSLATIEKLPIDRIKIDRAFVSSIDDRTVNRPVLDAIIQLAHQLKVGLIAEGVETRSQWNYLAARQVGCIQGFLIAKPMPVEAFVRWVSEQDALPSGLVDAPAAATVPGPALQDTAMRELWQRLGASGGLDIRDRMFRLRNYERCFVGREAVDWIARVQRVSRREAVRIGQRLMALGLMQHVLNEHDFSDADLFYRLSPATTAEDAAAMPATAELLQALRGPQGPVMQAHRRWGLLHRHCLTGRALVDWLVAQHRLPRSTAVQWAVQLMRQGRLRHVFDDRPFQDNGALYRPG